MKPHRGEMDRLKYMDRVLVPWLILLQFNLNIQSTTGQRKLCPDGWERWAYMCHKIIYPDKPINSFQEANSVCWDISPKVSLVKAIDKPIFTDIVGNILKEAGLSSTVIQLNDIEYETIFVWDDAHDMLWIHDLDEPKRTTIGSKFNSTNSEVTDCVEINDEGMWDLVKCVPDVPWTSVVCQQEILTGVVCELDGATINF